jgi:hypothetical protein
MFAMTRDLPPLPELAAELGRTLGASPSVLAAGDYPVAALAIAGRHFVLVRDHQHSVAISLPTGDQSWSWRSRQDWQAELPKLQSAVTAYRGQFATAISMADAIVVLAPALARITGEPWDVSFPGTPVPSEAWLKASDGRSVGVFQNAGSQRDAPSVNVVVWIGDEMTTTLAATAIGLGELPRLIEPLIAAQGKQLAVDAAEQQRVEALPKPELAHAVALLRGGKRIQAGGGRYSTTYYFEGDVLMQEIFDEGHVEIHKATEEDLIKSIGYYPDAFR